MNEFEITSRVSATVVLDTHEQGQTGSITELLLRDGSGNEYTAIVEAETFRTVSVRVIGGDFGCGDDVEAEYGGVTMPARLWHVEERPGGSWVLGLLWKHEK
jgi:hypothetical protein